MLPHYLKIVMAFCGVLFFSTPSFANVSEQQAQNIDATMQSIMHAYETHDLNALKNAYHKNAVIIGTGSDEIIQGRDNIIAAFQRDFSQSSKATIKIERIAVDIENGIVFASYKVFVNVQIPHSTPFQSTLRFSAGLVKENNHWFIIQSHLSAPLAEQKAGNSFPTT